MELATNIGTSLAAQMAISGMNIIPQMSAQIIIESHPTVGVQRDVCELMMISIFHPKHGFEGVYSRNPTNVSMR